MPNPWPDEQIEELKRLWMDGKSASQIGIRINRSRNSVIGKVHRLKLASRPTPIRPPKPPVMSRPKLPKPSLPPKPIVKSKKKPVRSLRLSLFELERGMCRWPDDGEGDVTFCGHPAMPDKSYCDKHVIIARRGNGHQTNPWVARARQSQAKRPPLRPKWRLQLERERSRQAG